MHDGGKRAGLPTLDQSYLARQPRPAQREDSPHMLPDTEPKLSKLGGEESGIRRLADSSTGACRRVAPGTEHRRCCGRHLLSVRSAGCPVPDDSAPRGTTTRHKTHRTEVRKIRYPWHPLFDSEVLIRGGQRKCQAAVYRCHVPGQERRNCFEVPQWIFDLGSCSRMLVRDHPHVCWMALQELKHLLEETSAASHTSVVEAQHRSYSDKGGADVEPSTNVAAGSTESVPAGTQSPTVGHASAREPRRSCTAVGPSASGSCEASAGRSTRCRGR